MPRVLQINVTANWGSTGKIAEQIGHLILHEGWESYIAYGRYSNPSCSKLIKIGCAFSVYEHYFENRLLDNEGFASRLATIRFINRIKKINPDIIHLHNIHDHYLNYPILFNYLSSLDIPIVWTQHDCWAYTGGCSYYSMSKCNKWIDNCDNCSFKNNLFDRSRIQYSARRKYFNNIRNFTLVPVSEWLSSEIKKSFLSSKKIMMIPNGIDTNTFKPIKSDGSIRKKFQLGDKHILLGIASVWEKRKGLDDFIELSQLLPTNLQIVLVGIPQNSNVSLPSNISPIPRTQNVDDLVALYNEASIVLNLSYEETFGLTTVEGLACGTPGVVYDCTASPELITKETGRIVKAGDVKGVYSSVLELISLGKSAFSEDCRKRAIQNYDQSMCFKKYINLYKELLELPLSSSGECHKG